MQDAPNQELTGSCWDKGVEALKRGKAAMERLGSSTRALLSKIQDPNDEVYLELKAMMKTLLSSTKAIDSAILLQEINEQPITRQTLNEFLQNQGQLATKLHEKLAGCQARVRNC